jgi:hypothetical protein
MHPSVIQGILPILSKNQTLELERMSSVRDHNGLTWEEHVSWSLDGVDRGAVGGGASLSSLTALTALSKGKEGKKEKEVSVEIDSDGSNNKKKTKRVVVARGGDCDFDVVTRAELMRMKLEDGGSGSVGEGRTTFEEHYVRWNKPVLVLGFSEEESEWENVKDTWGKESWITKMFGKETVVAGVIPYPEKFNMTPIKRTMQTFLRQIHSYEAKRLKAKEFESEGKKTSVMNARTLSVPPAYLFHPVDMITKPDDEDMGHHLLSNLGNFTPSLLPSKRTLLQNAQFYYGNYGR